MFKTLQPRAGRYFKVLGSLGYKDSEVTTWPDWVRNGQNGRIESILPSSQAYQQWYRPQFYYIFKKKKKNIEKFCRHTEKCLQFFTKLFDF